MFICDFWKYSTRIANQWLMSMEVGSNMCFQATSMIKSNEKLVFGGFDFEMVKGRRWSRACFLNLKILVVMFGLVDTCAKPVYLLFFLFIHVSAFLYHKCAIGPVGEGVRPLACATSSFFFHFVILFILFSLLILFFYPFILIILKICWTSTPLYLHLEYNGGFIYFIWIIFL